MKLFELKKAEPATTKSSGTDDPSKYVGKWEVYDEPQGINDRQDRKVLAKEAADDWNDKTRVWTGMGYNVVVDDLTDPGYITVWTDDNQRVGSMTIRRSGKKRGYMEVLDVDVDKQHRRNRLALRMYQVALQYMPSQYLGLIGYRPNIADPQKIEAIYKRLGGYVDPDNEDILVLPRQEFFENALGPEGETRFGASGNDDYPMIIGPEEKKAVRRSKRPDKATVRKSVRGFVGRGQKAQIDPDKLTEKIRVPILGNLDAEYEIIDDYDRTVGFARVKGGVIDTLDFLPDADKEYRGKIMSALLSQITSEADRHTANLSIQVVGMNQEIKSSLERFGFRLVGGSVMKRGHGSIRPVSVNPPQGMVNRED